MDRQVQRPKRGRELPSPSPDGAEPPGAGADLAGAASDLRDEDATTGVYMAVVCQHNRVGAAWFDTRTGQVSGLDRAVEEARRAPRRARSHRLAWLS
jgi:hypothetical protein